MRLHIDNRPFVWYTVSMNRKIQATDGEFIVARYRRDRHAFNAAEEAKMYGVSKRTIYNLISRAGLKMQRGRKPLVAPSPPPRLTGEEREEREEGQADDTAILLRTLLDAIDPLDSLASSDPPKPPLRTGKGPPAIQPPKPGNKNAE